MDHFERNGHQTGNALLFDFPLEKNITIKQLLQQVKTEVQQVYNYVGYDQLATNKRLDGRRFEALTPFAFIHAAGASDDTLKSNF